MKQPGPYSVGDPYEVIDERFASVQGDSRLRLDEDGRLWAAAGDGVHCFAADGTLIGKIRVPDPAASDVVFGGPKRNRLFICATTAIYSIHLHANGLARPGSRAE